MIKIALIAAGLLIIVIFSLIFRVNMLVGVLRGSYRRRVHSSNKVNAFLLLLFYIIGIGLFWWYTSSTSDKTWVPIASEHGKTMADLFIVSHIIIIVPFVIVNFLLFYFAFKYQHNDNRRGKYYPENNKLEIIWTVIPAIVLTVLVYLGWKTWSGITKEAPKEAVVVEVVGKQFNWMVRYPGMDGELGDENYKLIDKINQMGIDFSDKASYDDFTANTIHIPKGVPVKFKIRAMDVLHSVFLPHFRQKMDAVPGMPTSFWFVPEYTTEEMRTRTGDPNFNYELACAEICGKGHFGMKAMVEVDEPEEFEEWYKEQDPWIKQNKDYMSEHFPAVYKEKLAANSKTNE